MGPVLQGDCMPPMSPGPNPGWLTPMLVGVWSGDMGMVIMGSVIGVQAAVGMLPDTAAAAAATAAIATAEAA